MATYKTRLSSGKAFNEPQSWQTPGSQAAVETVLKEERGVSPTAFQAQQATFSWRTSPATSVLPVSGPARPDLPASFPGVRSGAPPRGLANLSSPPPPGVLTSPVLPSSSPSRESLGAHSSSVRRSPIRGHMSPFEPTTMLSSSLSPPVSPPMPRNDESVAILTLERKFKDIVESQIQQLTTSLEDVIQQRLKEIEERWAAGHVASPSQVGVPAGVTAADVSMRLEEFKTDIDSLVAGVQHASAEELRAIEQRMQGQLEQRLQAQATVAAQTTAAPTPVAAAVSSGAMEAQLAEQQNMIKELSSSLNVLQSQFSTLAEMHESTPKRLDSMEATCRTLQHRVAESSQALQDTQDMGRGSSLQLLDHANKHSQHEARHAEHDQRFEQLRGAIQEQAQKHDQQLRDVQARMADFSGLSAAYKQLEEKMQLNSELVSQAIASRPNTSQPERQSFPQDDGAAAEVAKRASREADNGCFVPQSWEATGNNADLVNLLSQMELFKGIDQKDIILMTEQFAPVKYSAGDVIIKQGDVGNAFYVLRAGSAAVSVHGTTGEQDSAMEDKKVVARLNAGDHFGELSLLRDEPRNATITAKTTVEALMITREKFKELGLQNKLRFKKRAAVGAGGGTAPKGVNWSRLPPRKTDEQTALMAKALMENANIAQTVILTKARIRKLIEVAYPMVIPKDVEIIKEGDQDADAMYIVQDGEFDISKGEVADQPGSLNLNEAVTKSNTIGTIGKGGSFGELALLYLAPRAATVTSKVQSVVWVIDRDHFKGVLKKSLQEVALEYKTFLDRDPIVLNDLDIKEKMIIAKSLQEIYYSRGETVYEQGEKANSFYIIYEGAVDVFRDGVQQGSYTAARNKVQIFGTECMHKNFAGNPRDVTIKVASDECRALYLDRESFDVLLGRADGAVPAPAQTSPAGGKANLTDFTRVGMLGCGGYGTVTLVENKKSKETFALKQMGKGYIVNQGLQKRVVLEKDIQFMCNSDFIIKLYQTFSDANNVYLLMELAQGGEVFSLYNLKGFYGSESHAKFYVSGVVLAFEHMHSMKTLYRDLKPENLLLNDKGHLKLADLGLAKVVYGKTLTMCGTPDYFAPELLESLGYSYSVDWWTVGILTCELMTGHPPFESTSPMETYKKIQRGIEKVTFSGSHCRGSCADFVRSLLQKDPCARPPMKKGGADNLKHHPWFQDYQWADRANNVGVPYVPKVASATDTGNFTEVGDDDLPPQMEYLNDGSDWDAGFSASTVG